MTQSQFSNASNRRRERGSSGGREDEGGTQSDVRDGEWRDKLDRAETVVRNKLPTVFSLDRKSWCGTRTVLLIWPGSDSATAYIISRYTVTGSTTRRRCLKELHRSLFAKHNIWPLSYFCAPSYSSGFLLQLGTCHLHMFMFF